MAKKKRRSRSMTIPLAPIVGLVSGLAKPIDSALKGDYQGALIWATRYYTGFDPEGRGFNFEWLKQGLLPLIGGLLVHKFVGGKPLNLNRMLARAGVPLIRI